jgi:membrane fusion protein, heavy metal efflux system
MRQPSETVRAGAVALVFAAAVAGLGSCRAADDRHATESEHAHDHHDEGAAEPARDAGADHDDDAHDDDGADAHHGDPHDDHGHAHVRVTPEQMARYDITVAVAGPATVEHVLELPGEVRANADRVAHVVPRFPGIAKDVRRNVGDTVGAGDVLAIIESSQSLAPYELRTLIGGTITEKHITRGELVDGDQPAFVVADLGSVWVDVSVYQQHLGGVHLDDPVRISAGAGVAEGEGRVSYITPAVDPATRTAVARVVLPNPDGRWRPGLFVSARVLHPADAALAVPKTAIQTYEGRDVVFVEEDGTFAPRPITIGRGGERNVEVLSGLRPGERYAATNTFLLKAELGKGAVEHAH